MPEVHLPHLDDHESHSAIIAAGAAAGAARRSRAPWKLLLEVVLISTGVFLGLAGEQWRESRRHHELALAALHRFRTELTDNQKSVARVKDYHAGLQTAFKAYFAQPVTQRKEVGATISGVQPAQFETSAWDLAISTQSLGDFDPNLALDISRVYRTQQAYTELLQALLQSMYIHSPYDGTDSFLTSFAVWIDDATIYEPRLLKMYDELLPKIDAALRE